MPEPVDQLADPAAIATLGAALAARPRMRLAHLPTPLDPCPHLGAELGVELFVKRDDATGLALGGNKTRQLEYILGQALADGHDCVIQGAASQSNHARQLAAAGAKLGLEVHLTPWQDARSRPVQGNYLLAHLYGAVLHPVPIDASSKEAKAALAARLRAEGRRPYVVGMGAHDALVLAAVAYADAFLELLAQLPDHRAPDWVFTTSQGSTQAGVLAAARWLGLDTRVVGINPMGSDHEAYSSPETIHQMVVDALERLGLPLHVPREDVTNDTGYVGEAYGVPSDAGVAALRRLARSEGITLDPVYTSKGFSGLLDYVDRGLVRPGERVVFIHTGGLPGLFAYSADLVEAFA
jgi:L-cysteate sulfo-lyase